MSPLTVNTALASWTGAERAEGPINVNTTVGGGLITLVDAHYTFFALRFQTFIIHH